MLEWWNDQVDWWKSQTFTMKWVYGFAELFLSVMLVGVAVKGPTRQQTPQNRERGSEVKRQLTDSEVEAKWNEQVEAAKLRIDEAQRSAADAWENARNKLKRMWIEGQEQ